jgi:hypothetical protein
MATRIDIEPVEVPREYYTKRVGHDEDVDRIVTEDADIYVEGELAIVYRHNWMTDKNGDDWIRTLDAHPNWSKGARSQGMRQQSTVFGFLPRRTMRADYCHRSSLDRDYPELASKVEEIASSAAVTLEEENPDRYKAQHAQVQSEILACYQMGPYPFTSGIINRDSTLMFHRDNANFTNSWSAMLGLKRNIREHTGVLVVPQLRTALEVGHGSLTMFDGKKWWHAVSPIRKTRRDGRRYTLVCYAVAQLRNCLPWEEEMQRALDIRTLREGRRAGLVGGGLAKSGEWKDRNSTQ